MKSAASQPDPAAGRWFALGGGLLNARVRFQKDLSGRVAFLGGSITAAEGWRDMTCRALCKRYPRTRFDFINAGIPSIDSTGDAFRLTRDVFSRRDVDLLFVDASVNDFHNERTARERIRAMEGIVRQARSMNPAIDIVFLCFADRAYLEPIWSGRTPPVIASHMKVARHYRIASINLAKEVADRIKAGRFAWEKFRDCHPSPFGHRLYAGSIKRMLDAAWSGPLPEGAAVKAHAMPARRLDPKSYAHGRLVGIEQATIVSGWRRVRSWAPNDKVATRNGFVKLPMLTAEAPGAALEFDFAGTAVGVFVTAGPDAGCLEYRIDGVPYGRVDQYTKWSKWLHLPWAVMLGGDLRDGRHKLMLRTSARKNPDSAGCACRIVHFLVNGPSTG
jgi:hypothetical protein